MKQQFFVFIIALVILTLTFGGALASNTFTLTITHPHSNVRVMTFVCSLDSADADTSAEFSLGNYDGHKWSDVEITYSVHVVTAGDSNNVTHYIEGRFPGCAWQAVDTVTAVTDETETVGALDMNNKDYPEYRIRAVDLAKLTNDTLAYDTLRLYIPTWE